MDESQDAGKKRTIPDGRKRTAPVGRKRTLPVSKKRKLPVLAVILIVLATLGLGLFVGNWIGNTPTTLSQNPSEPLPSPAQKFSGHGIAFDLPEGFNRLKDQNTPNGPMLIWNYSKSALSGNYNLLVGRNPGVSEEAFLNMAYQGLKAGLKADRILEETQEPFTVARKSRLGRRLVYTREGSFRIIWFFVVHEKDNSYQLLFRGLKSEETLLRKAMNSILATMKFSPR